MVSLAKLPPHGKSIGRSTWYLVSISTRSNRPAIYDVRFETRERPSAFREIANVHDIDVPWAVLLDFDAFRDAVFARHAIRLTTPRWAHSKPWPTIVNNLPRKGAR